MRGKGSSLRRLDPFLAMAIVVVPALLRKLTDGVERVPVTGRNLGQVIEDLERQFPGFREQLVQNGEMKPSIAVSIDGEMGTGGLLDRVKDSSEIFFIPAIGGG
ncbi:MAG TPA: MoaD/ThiS family protein [Candidatus Binataceae bacterium]|nr:MoaD/ThiS family protein [Candidatus Binataceae bacterium]